MYQNTLYILILFYLIHTDEVVVRLNEDINIEKVDLSFIQKVLNTSDEYVESYQYH